MTFSYWRILEDTLFGNDILLEDTTLWEEDTLMLRS